MDLLERARLLEELDGQLAATATGGRVVLVAGEAGIGKSALVRRFSERHAAGARVLLGACDPLLTPRALGPLHDIARQTGGRLAGLLAEASPREQLFAALLDGSTRPPGRRWWWSRTPTGPTRRPWTCWSSGAGASPGPGRCRWSPTGTTSWPSTTRCGRSSAGCPPRRCAACTWSRCPRRPWPSWPAGPAARPPGCAPSPAGTRCRSPRFWQPPTPACPRPSVARARRRLFDPVGHYNRPDVFRLVVDDRPKPHLVSLARAATEPPG